MFKPNYYKEEISTAKIIRNPDNPFKNMEDGSFVRLLNSIRKFGIIEPIAVREKDGKYEIIAGQRRVYAAELLGIKTVPAIIHEVNDDEAIILAVDSNVTLRGVTEDE